MNLTRLCLLLLLTGTTAFAHCRPENRVWNFSEKSSDSASQEVAKPLAASGESAACGYDFASGVHKYLYCKDNPVNGSDPSGHFECNMPSLTLAMAEGEAIDTALMGPVVAVARAEIASSLAFRIGAWAIIGTAVGGSVGIGTVGIVDAIDDIGLYEERQRVATQTLQKANPTGSQHAYQNFECDTFAADAEKYFKARNIDAHIIRFDAGRAKIKKDEIWATMGFFSGLAVSESAYHEGLLVDGEVYDNNLPFGVSRRVWEKYSYVVDPMGDPQFSWIPLRKACERNLGTITVMP